MTFTNVVSLIGTLVGIAAAIGGLMTYILKQNSTRKQVTLVFTTIGVALVCVIILAEGISPQSTQSTSTQTQKTTITLVTATIHVSSVATVYV